MESGKVYIDSFLERSSISIKKISGMITDELLEVLGDKDSVVEKYSVLDVIVEIINSEIYGVERRDQEYNFEKEFRYYLKHSLCLNIQEKKQLLSVVKLLPDYKLQGILSILKNEYYGLYELTKFNDILGKRISKRKYSMLLNYI